MKRDFYELDEGTGYIGFREALDIIAANVQPLGEEERGLDLCVGRVAAADVVALVSYPSVAVSLKDGYAVKSAEIASASRDKPVCLKVAGAAFAGTACRELVKEGRAVKVCSGAPVPAGADAVVSGEFCTETSPEEVLIKADAGLGRNIMTAGSEVKAGTVVIRKGETLSPGKLGLAAAAGLSALQVYRRPHAAIVSIGDEIVKPGEKLHIGQLYASNLVTMESWLALFGLSCRTCIVADDAGAIQQELQRHLSVNDAVFTSGGAWGSERDLAIGVLDSLGWRKIFHYLRMGPGKGTAFGMFEDKPVFCLPGGPLSNEMAFLQLALPALLRMSGETRHPLPTVFARLSEEVKSRHRAWTEFKDAVVTRTPAGSYIAAPYKSGSRLKSIAGAGGLICIPEGQDSLPRGAFVPVQLLTPRPE